MNYAIIAAGEGSRLVKEGINCPKPIIEVNGEPMIKRLLDIFSLNNAKEISIIINEEIIAVKQYVESLNYSFQIKFKIKTTLSSMHSLFEMRELISNEVFCLTTVDTIFKPKEFEAFINFAKNQTDKDAVMAVTTFKDDESPLFIKTKEDKIIEFSDKKSDCKYVSGGIYYLQPRIWSVLEKSITSGNQRMRNFQRDLLKADLKIGFYEFSKIIDVDHAKDIEEAEKLLK
ncbi:MAG: NTP transferase domain-containing protein [Bacteroidetes bacterium]|nr:NTP transferase domain-containing protein [Bacteroidota bacterium]